MKSNLICSDYEGVVQLWDVSQQAETMTFEEHAKRVWSVDFSQVSYSCGLSDACLCVMCQSMCIAVLYYALCWAVVCHS